LFALLVVLLSSALAFAQFRTVTVQNANGNPVPTTIQNTPTVNVNGTVPVSGTVSATITGTPSVNATITNTPSVSVTGTPTVSVSNLPTGTAGPGPTTGVLVKSLDNPAQQVFQRQLLCNTVAAGATTCTVNFTVPAGKVLVIEYVQMISIENGGSGTAFYELITTAGGLDIPYYFAPTALINGNNRIGEHLTRIYADPGSTVTFIGYENNTSGTVNFGVTFSGYLVNVP